MRQESNSGLLLLPYHKKLIATLPAVDRWCRYVYGCKYSADITSEVKLIALEKGFEDRGVKLSTWLTSIAINLYKAQAKYNAWHPPSLGSDCFTAFIYQDNNLDDGYYTNLINTLPAYLRRLLRYRMDGYSVREIVVLTKLKHTSVKSAITVARKKLKQKLK